MLGTCVILNLLKIRMTGSFFLSKNSCLKVLVILSQPFGIYSNSLQAISACPESHSQVVFAALRAQGKSVVIRLFSEFTHFGRVARFARQTKFAWEQNVEGLPRGFLRNVPDLSLPQSVICFCFFLTAPRVMKELELKEHGRGTVCEQTEPADFSCFHSFYLRFGSMLLGIHAMYLVY